MSEKFIISNIKHFNPVKGEIFAQDDIVGESYYDCIAPIMDKLKPTVNCIDNPVNIIGHYDVDNGVVFYRQTDGKCVMFDVNAVIEEKYRPFTALESVKENNILYVWDGEKYQPMKS